MLVWLNPSLKPYINYLLGENPLEQSSCPIAGQYHGVLPDSSQLCAKIVSDCNNLVSISLVIHWI